MSLVLGVFSPTNKNYFICSKEGKGSGNVFSAVKNIKTRNGLKIIPCPWWVVPAIQYYEKYIASSVITVFNIYMHYSSTCNHGISSQLLKGFSCKKFSCLSYFYLFYFWPGYQLCTNLAILNYCNLKDKSKIF